MMEIGDFGVLFLVLLAIAALAVWHVRDIVIFYFKDKYGIDIKKKEEENECEALDIDC